MGYAMCDQYFWVINFYQQFLSFEPGGFRTRPPGGRL